MSSLCPWLVAFTLRDNRGLSENDDLSGKMVHHSVDPIGLYMRIKVVVFCGNDLLLQGKKRRRCLSSFHPLANRPYILSRTIAYPTCNKRLAQEVHICVCMYGCMHMHKGDCSYLGEVLNGTMARTKAVRSMIGGVGEVRYCSSGEDLRCTDDGLCGMKHICIPLCMP